MSRLLRAITRSKIKVFILSRTHSVDDIRSKAASYVITSDITVRFNKTPHK